MHRQLVGGPHPQTQVLSAQRMREHLQEAATVHQQTQVSIPIHIRTFVLRHNKDNLQEGELTLSCAFKDFGCMAVRQ